MGSVDSTDFSAPRLPSVGFEALACGWLSRCCGGSRFEAMIISLHELMSLGFNPKRTGRKTKLSFVAGLMRMI